VDSDDPVTALGWDDERFRSLRKALRPWYRRHARDLPWRRTRDPYRIWISEIMLQQTTVTAVVPYFDRFLHRFPSIADLALADEQEVLRHWEGLGYYSRARNIHRAARQLHEESSGEFPRDVAALQALPGIGRYTAGAIASFAFDLPAPIVEANTLRLYSRLLALTTDPRTSAGQRALWEFAGRVLPRREAGAFNQALMELGSQVCTPVEPNCAECPLQRCCGAFAAGLQREIPAAVKRPDPTPLVEAAVAVERDGAYLLHRRPPGARWAGLWDFPRFGCDPEERDRAAAVAAQLREHFGVEVEMDEQIAEFRHTVTRYRITLHCYRATLMVAPPAATADQRWATPAEFADYPLCVTGRKLARLLGR
jgi:A/G-specific adenine glycosylase